MIIKSKSPTRVDLAGGTIDLGILYLLHDKPCTINFAVDQYSNVKIITNDDISSNQENDSKKIIIISKDLDEKIEFESIDKIHHNHKLSLITRVIEFYKPKKGFTLISNCMAPAGAGLAGSSSLNISLNGALNKLTNKNYSEEEMIWIAKNIETQVLKIPTGSQDYFPEMFGGLNCINLNIDEVSREELDYDLEKLKKRFVICFSGKSRNSGMSNWDMYKNHIDKKEGIYEKFEEIVKTAKKMKQAFLKQDLEKVGELINEEWKNRKKLSDLVTNEKIDSLISIAKENGAISAKVLGAGGGGCIVFFVKKDKKENVKDALNKVSKVIDFNIDDKGLQVEIIKNKNQDKLNQESTVSNQKDETKDKLNKKTIVSNQKNEIKNKLNKTKKDSKKDIDIINKEKIINNEDKKNNQFKKQVNNENIDKEIYVEQNKNINQIKNKNPENKTIFKDLKTLIFDLDDTLFDCYNQSVTPAKSFVIEKLINEGLDVNLLEAKQEWNNLSKDNNTDKVIEILTKKFSKDEETAKQLNKLGLYLYYNYYKLAQPKIYVFESVKENLNKLKNKYNLVLLTFGEKETQGLKIKNLTLSKIFNKILIQDFDKGHNKLESMKQIINELNILPKEAMMIGNRRDSDIRPANTIGLKTTLINYGEHTHLKPKDNFDKGDLEFDHINEFFNTII